MNKNVLVKSLIAYYSRIPFCTHEGSGMGNSERDIKKLCPNAKVLPGLAIRGGNVKNADGLIKSWLS